MSNADMARINDAVARNLGTRWCSTCQMDKPAEGFKKTGARWICACCVKRRKARALSGLYSGAGK